METLEALRRGNHRPVAAEHNSARTQPVHIIHEGWRKPAECICRGIDIEVGKFHRQCDEFIKPGKSNMAAYGDEFREVEKYILEIRNKPAVFRAFQRASMTYLRTEGNAQLNAGGIDRVVAP